MKNILITLLLGLIPIIGFSQIGVGQLDCKEIVGNGYFPRMVNGNFQCVKRDSSYCLAGELRINYVNALGVVVDQDVENSDLCSTQVIEYTQINDTVGTLINEYLLNCSVTPCDTLFASCKPLPAAISKITATAPDANGISTWTNTNTKPDGSPIGCGECGGYDVYLETSSSFVFWQTIEGLTGDPASSATSTMLGGTEDILNHIVGTDTLFDCQGGSSFDLAAEDFIAIIAGELNLYEAVTIKFFTKAGGDSCPNAPAMPSCSLSSNTDNFTEICTNIVLQPANVFGFGFLGLATSNWNVVSIGDSLFENIIIEYTNGIFSTISIFDLDDNSPVCLPHDQNGMLINGSALTSTCDNVFRNGQVKVEFSKPLPCVGVKIIDQDINTTNPEFSEFITNISPSSDGIDPILGSIIGTDLTITSTDQYGFITGITPNTPNNDYWLNLENTQVVTFDWETQRSVTFKAGELRLCGCN